jgi:hypothetical protein
MAARKNQQEVTAEQLAHCTRHLDEYGRVFYRVRSESDPDVIYTVRWYRDSFVWSDNCPAGIHGTRCKHIRWVERAEELYQQTLATEEPKPMPVHVPPAAVWHRPTEVSQKGMLNGASQGFRLYRR